ncbi:MAG: AAA family ATPase [Bacteroidaceae bacterium]|nr:AAA family ATPase [Bacteroidaceae bacterium]
MTKIAQYINRIEIKSLWSGRKHIVWQLRPDVNVLSGRNGAGKSTILNRIIQQLRTAPPTGEIPGKPVAGVRIDFEPQDATSIRYDIIRSFDRVLLDGPRLQTVTEEPIATELDWQLYQLQRRYLDYQVNVANRMIALLSEGSPQAQQQAMMASEGKRKFLDMVDSLFADTEKKIDRSSNELRFIQYGEPLSPYRLSSGEKQMLIILLTALTEDRQPYVLCMDEPEASLHFEWQKDLIGMIRTLNPHAQIILTTHSPGVIMNGWDDAVTEVGDITQ